MDEASELHQSIIELTAQLREKEEELAREREHSRALELKFSDLALSVTNTMLTLTEKQMQIIESYE